MKKNSTLFQFLMFAIILLTISPTSISAQGMNDVGITPTNITTFPTQDNWDSGDGVCPPVDFKMGTITDTNTQTDRLNRNGVASACPGKAYPGPFNPFFPNDYYYEVLSFPNAATTATCITIDFDPTIGDNPCSDNSTFFDAHIAAYSTAYNPNDFSENYLGDIGNSSTGSFSFDLPAGEDLVLAVFNLNRLRTCGFAFRVQNLDCEEPQTEPLPLMSKGTLLLMAITILGLGLLLVGRFK